MDVEPGGELRAAVTFVRGTTREQEFTLRREARRAGFHRVLVVPALDAARRGLRGGVGRNVPLILLDTERSQLGVGSQHDWVRPIPGREARELAVSLRCMLKPLPPRERRERLERVVVAAPEPVLERFGRRGIEEELEAIGAERVEFHEETLALARGALISAARAPEARWRRVSRR
ncbi:MAG: hypothetical protein R3F62_22135 [Planctomycetota bacterium]